MTQTEQVYYREPYTQQLHGCEVVRLEEKGPLCLAYMDRTVFFPEGGGQPCDQGEIIGVNGLLKIDQVRMEGGGAIVHQGKLTGRLGIGESVRAVLKWPVRYKNMRVHSAGHLLHDVLMTMAESLVPTKGNHGSKAYLEYRGTFDPNKKQAVEEKTNEILAHNLPIVTRDASNDEITSICRFVPAGLPRDKQLRIIKIGDFDAMPDGGVQVRSTGEIGGVVIHNINSENGVVTIRYGVKN